MEIVNALNKHLSIIHLEKRVDRYEHLQTQLKEQGITDYSIVPGFIDLAAVFRGICNSHKSVIRLAKQKGWSNCIVGEDDICFAAPGAWNYFLEQLELNKEADIFLCGIYEGNINPADNRIVDYWCGMTLYSVNERYYDKFLSIKDMNHIDRELSKDSKKAKFIVCNPFVAYQIDGWSDNKKKHASYGHLLKGRNMYEG